MYGPPEEIPVLILITSSLAQRVGSANWSKKNVGIEVGRIPERPTFPDEPADLSYRYSRGGLGG